jgi:hypothetical protein
VDFLDKLQQASAPTLAQAVPAGAQESPAILRSTLAGGAVKSASKPASTLTVVTRELPTAARAPGDSMGDDANPTDVAPRPVDPPPIQVAASPPPPPSTADIAPPVEAYARAIESRNIAAIRRVSPALTPEQQRSFEQLFQAARSINVTLRVASVEASGMSADARVVGTYVYITPEGRKERQPVNLAATFRYDGNAWRLVSMR